MKDASYYLTINIYYCSIHVYVVDDLAPAQKKYDLDISGTWMARCFCRENIDVPCVMVFKKDKVSPAVVMHECIHAALYILNSKGITVDSDNDETLTYFSMWLFESIYNSTFEPWKLKQ